MKCIVQSLLDESAMELREELMKSEGLQLDANLEDEDVQVIIQISIYLSVYFSIYLSN